MNEGPAAHHGSVVGDGDAPRRRSVGDAVLSAVLDIPAPPARVTADWEREVVQHLALAPGDVESLPLVRTRARWPDHRLCVQAMARWTHSLGLQDVLATADLALMACRGARYHHDAAQYGRAAFCNLFLSDDKGLDVHFPAIGRRIALTRGTALLFDTGQPHAVVLRGEGGFDATRFMPGQDCTQVFLSWELPLDDARVAKALHVAFDVAPGIGLQVDAGQLRLRGASVDVCPDSGRWSPAGG
ncbi:hypothetical protein ACFPPF_17140 [Xenophilus aerolatus]|nr:hypothetical protein [Xenophilus aerolatus]